MAQDVYPIDYSSPVGILRNAIGDTVRRIDPAVPDQPAEFMFSDDQLNAFILLSPTHIKFAAANAVDVLASNEALISKKIRTEDLQTDGPAVANALREHAKALRSEARNELEADDGGFEIVDFHAYPAPWTLVY